MKKWILIYYFYGKIILRLVLFEKNYSCSKDGINIWKSIEMIHMDWILELSILINERYVVWHLSMFNTLRDITFINIL